MSFNGPTIGAGSGYPRLTASDPPKYGVLNPRPSPGDVQNPGSGVLPHGDLFGEHFGANGDASLFQPNISPDVITVAVMPYDTSCFNGAEDRFIPNGTPVLLSLDPKGIAKSITSLKHRYIGCSEHVTYKASFGVTDVAEKKVPSSKLHNYLTVCVGPVTLRKKKLTYMAVALQNVTNISYTAIPTEMQSTQKIGSRVFLTLKDDKPVIQSHPTTDRLSRVLTVMLPLNTPCLGTASFDLGFHFKCGGGPVLNATTAWVSASTTQSKMTMDTEPDAPKLQAKHTDPVVNAMLDKIVAFNTSVKATASSGDKTPAALNDEWKRLKSSALILTDATLFGSLADKPSKATVQNLRRDFPYTSLAGVAVFIDDSDANKKLFAPSDGIDFLKLDGSAEGTARAAFLESVAAVYTEDLEGISGFDVKVYERMVKLSLLLRMATPMFLVTGEDGKEHPQMDPSEWKKKRAKNKDKAVALQAVFAEMYLNEFKKRTTKAYIVIAKRLNVLRKLGDLMARLADRSSVSGALGADIFNKAVAELARRCSAATAELVSAVDDWGTASKGKTLGEVVAADKDGRAKTDIFDILDVKVFDGLRIRVRNHAQVDPADSCVLDFKWESDTLVAKLQEDGLLEVNFGFFDRTAAGAAFDPTTHLSLYLSSMGVCKTGSGKKQLSIEGGSPATLSRCLFMSAGYGDPDTKDLIELQNEGSEAEAHTVMLGLLRKYRNVEADPAFALFCIQRNSPSTVCGLCLKTVEGSQNSDGPAWFTVKNAGPPELISHLALQLINAKETQSRSSTSWPFFQPQEEPEVDIAGTTSMNGAPVKDIPHGGLAKQVLYDKKIN